MPFLITVSVDDERHSQHDECVSFMNESSVADWDDFKDNIDDEEIEVDYEEWRAWREENGY